MTSTTLDSRVMTAMTKIGNLVATVARSKVKTTRMVSAISLSKATKLSDGEYAIDLVIDLKKAPEFMAYEKGSGIHGKSGEKYVIKPKKAKALAFPFTLHWTPSESKYLGGYDGSYYVNYASTDMELNSEDGDGELSLDPSFWKYVEHPGVRAEPAVVPAFKETNAETAKIFKQEVGMAISLLLKEVTKSNVKHR